MEIHKIVTKTLLGTLLDLWYIAASLSELNIIDSMEALRYIEFSEKLGHPKLFDPK